MTAARCPDCGAALPAAPVACPACALPLRGQVAAELWSVDQQLGALAARRSALVLALRAQRGDPPPTPSGGPVAVSAYPAPAPRAQAARIRPGGQQVLLALGVLVLVVAAAVFLAVAWHGLGAAGQTAVLLALTAAALVGSRAAQRRDLTATAEATAALACGFAVVDLAGAHALDLAGLGGVDGGWYLAGGAALLAAATALAGRWGRPVRAFGLASVLACAVVPAAVAVATGLDAGGGAVVAVVAAAAALAARHRLPLPRPLPALVGGVAAAYTPAAVALGLVAMHRAPLRLDAVTGSVAVLAVAIGCLRRARAESLPRAPWLLAGGVVTAAGAVDAAGHAGAAGLATLASLSFVGSGLVLVAERWSGRGLVLGPGLTTGSAGVAALGALADHGHEVGTAISVALAAATLALVTLAVRVPLVRAAAAGGAVATAGAAVVALTHHHRAWAVLLLAVVGCAAAGVAAVRRERPEEPAVAVVAVLVSLVALAVALPENRLVAATLAVVGLVAFGYSILPARGWTAVPGVAALSFASWVLLHDAGVGLVEAYSLPVAALAGGVGLVRLRRDPGAPSWQTVGPACSAALLPSACVAAAGSGGFLRAAVVLAVGAAVCAAGVRAGWLAPTVTGAVAVALVAVSQLAPLAAGIPRWLTLSVVGAGLMVLGARYERRLADARRAARWVASLH